MLIQVISDTHDQHEKLGALPSDVLIHCGDMFNRFNQSESAVEHLDDWFGRQNFESILCIGDNHDVALEEKLMSTV